MKYTSSKLTGQKCDKVCSDFVIKNKYFTILYLKNELNKIKEPRIFSFRSTEMKRKIFYKNSRFIYAYIYVIS
jgi:hypothetical protein